MPGNARPWKRWVLLGLVMMAASHGFETMGDAAPFVEDGVSTERLMFHGIVLLLVIGQLFCGFKVVRALIGSISDKATGGSVAAVARVFSEEAHSPQAPQASQEFDPDAAFARYMEKKAAGEVTPTTRPRPAAPVGGFGRKGA